MTQLISDFQEKYGPWALVTGASSGIGEQFTRYIAHRGVNVVLVARRLARLTRLANELRETTGVQTRVVNIDLSTTDFLERIEAATNDLEIGLLINNAGFTITQDFLDSFLENQVKLLNVNAKAPMMLTHSFGRKMRDRKRGGIVFVSSIAAFSAVPRWANYAASKAYLMQFGEALAVELNPHNVDVLVVAPGTTNTDFIESAEIEREVNILQPEDVAKQTLEKLGSTATYIPGWRNRVLSALSRVAPSPINTMLAGRLLRWLQE